MPDYSNRRQKCDGSIASESDDCPECGATTRRFGRTGGHDVECPNCGVIDSTRHQLVADGSGDAYDILAGLNDPAGHSDRLQQYLDDDLLANDLTAADIVEPLKLALGKLCLQVEHNAKTEVIWVTEDGFVSKTRHHDHRDDWGPIAVDETAIEARLHEGKALTVRTHHGAALEPPESAILQYDPDTGGRTEASA